MKQDVRAPISQKIPEHAVNATLLGSYLFCQIPTHKVPYHG